MVEVHKHAKDRSILPARVVNHSAGLGSSYPLTKLVKLQFGLLPFKTLFSLGVTEVGKLQVSHTLVGGLPQTY